jgi:FtsP/CotA-like multicopper oxidase with cupredoxin domain
MALCHERDIAYDRADHPYIISEIRRIKPIMHWIKVGLLFTLLLVITGCSNSLPKIPEPSQTENGVSAVAATPTPGRMTSVEGNHMMEPISGDPQGGVSTEKGGQPLAFTLDGDTKVFELTTRAVNWPILDEVVAAAWTYNGTIPGPMIRVTEGDKVRINLKNELPVPTTIHWHGIAVPNAMDGIPNVTQDPVAPGESFTYEFTASPAGTYMYHSHFEGDIQVSAGLYAPFIIDPTEPTATQPDVDVNLMFSEMLIKDGQTFAAMPMAGMEPNYFTINGKAFPNTETIEVKKGQLVRLRLTSIGQFVHPIHLHGVPFKIVATDGHPVPEAAQLTKDTVLVAPGERYDIEFVATEPGQWMLHCHILHHTTNDNVEPGGLMLMINVSE